MRKRPLVRVVVAMLVVAAGLPVVRPADATVVICDRHGNMKLRHDACKAYFLARPDA